MPTILLPALTGLALLAQAAPSSASRSAAPIVAVVVEDRVGHEGYRFDYPSTFDTTSPVPHHFDQRYDTTGPWLRVSVAYWWLGAHGSTEVGLSTRRTALASDVDTFFDPGGDVITSGTDGPVRRQAWSIDQRFELAAAGAWTFGVTMGFARARADFLPADLVVTHTQPPSVASTFTTDRESTVSRLVQSGFTAAARWPFGHGWHAEIALDGLPIVSARLTTSLPDKFASNIVDSALSFAVRGRALVEHRLGRMTAGLEVGGSGARGYRHGAAYHERSVAAGLFLRIGG